MKNAFFKAALAAGFILSAATGYSETLTFFGNGVWTNPGLWYRFTGNAYTIANKVPDSTDDAVIGAGAVCDAGAGGLHSIVSLTILLTSQLNNGQFDANTYTFAINSAPGQGSTLVVTGANFNVRSSGAMNFNVSNVFINNSTITFQGGSFANVTIGPSFSGTTIFNQGSFVIQGGAAVTFAGSNNRFDNIGDIRGNGGTSQFNAGFQNLTLNNSGTIAAYADGNLVINGNIIWAAEDATHDGSFFAVTVGAKITMQGPLVVPAGATYYFKGPGTVNVTAGVTVNGTLQVGVPGSGPVNLGRVDSAPELVDEAGTVVIGTISGNQISEVKGPGFINDVIGTLQWAQAATNDDGNGHPNFSGSINVSPGATFAITGGSNNGTASLTMNGMNIANHGLVTFNISTLGTRGMTFTNFADGTVNCLAPLGVSSTGAPAPTFENFNVWNTIGGASFNPPSGFSGVTSNAPVFNNHDSGILNVTGSGFFQLSAGKSTGKFAYTPDFTFTTNPYQLAGSATFDGPGNVVIKNFGALFAQTGANITIPKLTIDVQGTLDGPGNFIMSNDFNFRSGTIKGTGTLETHGMTFYAGTDVRVVNGRIIVNSGVWTVSGTGELDMAEGAVINNQSGGVFDIQTNWSLTGSLQNTPTFNNLLGGTFKRSVGTGTAAIGINFNNYGTVDLRSGLTNFYNFQQFGGSTLLNGGNFGTVGGTPIVFHGGDCGGNGSFTGDVTFDTIVGHIRTSLGPGFSPGKITINGNYTQKPDAILNIEVAGVTAPGVDYDQVVVTGTATLGGTLRVTDINGFKPSPNDIIVPLTAGSITGTFDSTNAQVNYGSTSLTVAALPSPLVQLLNISTRMRVLTGENVLIAGFIITGNDPKKVIIRGIGPSLANIGVQGALTNPTLELHQGASTLATNDDWKKKPDGSSQQAEIEATTIPPSNDLESALVATLNPGAYTAILAGSGGGTGIGLVEVYDLAQAANSQIANISTRGFVDTNDNVMIGGIIAGPGNALPSRVLIRAIGPALQNVGVANALGDPTLELRDVNGALLAANDNWKLRADGSSQQAEIEATTVPPTNDLESAVLQSVLPGNYTAIVRGKNNTTGVGLVEVYNLQ